MREDGETGERRKGFSFPAVRTPCYCWASSADPATPRFHLALTLEYVTSALLQQSRSCCTFFFLYWYCSAAHSHHHGSTYWGQQGRVRIMLVLAKQPPPPKKRSLSYKWILYISNFWRSCLSPTGVTNVGIKAVTGQVSTPKCQSLLHPCAMRCGTNN